ncbi:hypothetical protein FACS1894199_08260 [Bacteroidia bacterium]|nr:hypothetical protein FACS1894199_08260 [Bacteroidia bacterium]
MSESQNIEYKSSWHEEYLDWICGFANAQGGKIYIGKDDNGIVIGVADYKDLMEKIPNKIKNQLGISAEVNLLQEAGKHYIEIVVTPYSVPISLRGRYFYRSGSVKQELTGAYIKIGFFRTDSDLLFQDEIHGNLFEQVEKTVDFLLTKYTKALISYEGLTRVETYEYPKDALREALLNAVSHKDYTGPYPIQISVYADKIMMWNYGRLPENWTVEDLLDKHSSQPRNPDIATAFFRSGYVESWGRGMDKMKNLCLEANIPVPQFSCKGNDFWTIFRKDIYNKEDLSKLGLNERQIKAVLYVKEKGKITNSEYQVINNVTEQTALRDIKALIENAIFIKAGTNKDAKYEINNVG